MVDRLLREAPTGSYEYAAVIATPRWPHPDVVRTAFVVGLSLVAAGCYARYELPANTTDTAVLRLNGTPTFGASSERRSNRFEGFTTETCEKHAGEGRLATFTGELGKIEEIRIPAGHRYYIVGTTSHTGSTPFGRLEEVCRAVVSFVPEASRVYDISQGTSANFCPVIVLEENASEGLLSLQQHPVSGSCRTLL